MASDRPIYDELRLDPAELTISAREVGRLGRCGPSPRWRSDIEAAIDDARSLIEPRGRLVPLPDSAPAEVFPTPTPVLAIASAGRAWAFVATIGGALEARVREHFANARFLEGVLLDAAGSTAVEAVADELEATCASRGTTERFSPGYCAWSLEAQQALFALLRPEELGIELLPSRLMRPLKSVSGVIVRAEPEVLLVPAWTCAQCDARGCTRRQAAGPEGAPD